MLFLLLFWAGGSWKGGWGGSYRLKEAQAFLSLEQASFNIYIRVPAGVAGLSGLFCWLSNHLYLVTTPVGAEGLKDAQSWWPKRLRGLNTESREPIYHSLEKTPTGQGSQGLGGISHTGCMRKKVQTQIEFSRVLFPSLS